MTLAPYKTDGFHFSIPGPARGKGRPRFGKSRAGFAVAYTDEKTAAYENLVKMAAREAAHRDGIKLFTGPVLVGISAFYAPPASWSKKKQTAAINGEIWPKLFDVDNVAKAILDGLNGIAFDDDKQVVSLDISKRYSTVSQCYVSVFPERGTQ